MNNESYSFTYDLILDEKRILGDLRFLRKFLQTQLKADSEEKSNYHIINQKIMSLEKNFYHSSKLLRDLIEQIYDKNKVSSQLIVNHVKKSIESSEHITNRMIEFDVKCDEVKIDHEIVDTVSPILSKVIGTLLEFSIESFKERKARSKRDEILFKIDLREEIDSVRLLVFCDGNGLEPPFLREHASLLSDYQVYCRFEGRPGKCSAWIFNIPKNKYSFRVLNFTCERKILALPMNLILSSGNIDESWIKTNPNFLNFNKENFSFKKNNSFFPDMLIGKAWIKVGIGSRVENLIVDEIYSNEEVYLRPLSNELNPENRFLGVALSNQADNNGLASELVLVLNLAKLKSEDKQLGSVFQPTLSSLGASREQ